MSADINVMFCRRILSAVKTDVKKFDKTVNFKEPKHYIESPNTNGGIRWAYMNYRGFHWEGYADNAYDAMAQGWQAWLDQNIK